MDVLGSANQVLLNWGGAQSNRSNLSRALASGLRISSAADDPSGLAIAENLHSQVLGFQQSAASVQTANNLLTVADGVLAASQVILQRIHTLAIQAHSDINSDRQLSAIQTEIDQLKKELNAISSEASFNGITLFNGSLDNSQATKPQVRVEPAETNPDGSVPTPDVYDAAGSGSPNPGPLIYNANVQTQAVRCFIQFQVVSYSSNPVDPITGPLGQPGCIIRTSIYSQDPSFGAAPQTVQDSALPTNVGPDAGTGAQLQITSPSGASILLSFDLANLSQQDVGVAMSFVVDPGRPAATGHQLHIHDGAREGTSIGISLPSLSTDALNISDINVSRPGEVDAFNNPIGLSSSNNFAADDAQVRAENAMQQVGAIRAIVGAQSVSLTQDATNDSVAIVNQTASESSVRDANIAGVYTQFIQAQVRGALGLSVLSAIQSDARLIAQLFSAALLRT